MSTAPCVLATGIVWARQGGRTIDAVMRELLAQAKRDVIMTVYLVTAVQELTRAITGRCATGAAPAGLCHLHRV